MAFDHTFSGQGTIFSNMKTSGGVTRSGTRTYHRFLLLFPRSECGLFPRLLLVRLHSSQVNIDFAPCPGLSSSKYQSRFPF